MTTESAYPGTPNRRFVACVVCGGHPDNTLHGGYSIRGHRYEPVATGDSTPETIKPASDEREQPIRLVMAPRIVANSWLNEERFSDFRRGYEYAQNATMAIEPLSKLTPEETYWLFTIIEHGIEFTRPVTGGSTPEPDSTMTAKGDSSMGGSDD